MSHQGFGEASQGPLRVPASEFLVPGGEMGPRRSVERFVGAQNGIRASIRAGFSSRLKNPLRRYALHPNDGARIRFVADALTTGRTKVA